MTRGGGDVTREIVLDTETTGLDARRGDRLIELGCVELINHFPSGREFHRFISPETRDVHPDAFAIHGISTEFLKDKPKFRDVVDDFLTFIGEDTLVIHNATFDIGFINMELELLKRPPLGMSRVVDTLQLARRKHPAGPNTLDALCKRYNIDNSRRDKHGAIVDSLLLAEVYIEMTGTRQAALVLGAEEVQVATVKANGSGSKPVRERMQPLAPRLSEEDLAAHAKFVDSLGEKALWRRMR